MSEYIVKVEGQIPDAIYERQIEEIVRCRDCDYYDHWEASGRYKEKHVCGHWDCLEIKPDGFCAWAERKD